MGAAVISVKFKFKNQEVIMHPIVMIVSIVCISLFLLWLGIATVIAAKHAAEKEYLCPKCGKTFSPRKRDALGAAVSFGHKSVLVRCTHCRNKERLLPTDAHKSLHSD